MVFLPRMGMGRNTILQPPKILDNKQQGRVIDELHTALQPGAKLSVISAYFTIYAAVYLIFACVVKAEDSLKMGFRLKSLQNL